jgi:AcrR family transcriptional regulator
LSVSRRERTKAQNRRTILEAAARVFAEMGYGAATVRDIIRATSLASGTFYNYFKSKEEVFQALRDESALLIRPRLREARASARTAEEFVHSGFRVLFEFLASGDANFGIAAGPDQTRVRMDTPEILAGFAELRADLERAIAAGVFPQVDADYLMAALEGVAFEIGERMTKRATIDPDSAAAFATALFMGGVNALPKLTNDTETT